LRFNYRSQMSQLTVTHPNELLNRHLAAAIDLHSQLKQAHWNVRGPTFIAVSLVDKVAGAADTYSDFLERAGAGRGAVAEGTVQVAIERSFLVRYPLPIADESQHLLAVAATLAAFGQSAREAIQRSAAVGDADTADLFTGISRGRRPSARARRIACGTDMQRNGRLRKDPAGQSRRFHDNCDSADRDQ